jgi:hypothetical protein
MRLPSLPHLCIIDAAAKPDARIVEVVDADKDSLLPPGQRREIVLLRVDDGRGIGCKTKSIVRRRPDTQLSHDCHQPRCTVSSYTRLYCGRGEAG